ncbi:MAG: hypothetical protein DRN15_00395 [Thermoprotei archaeon]|nr:MAG: hypothetical protein DRM97_07295 [Thermoprotei archaeon]RLF25152.1 MAG: hypothetical protein DRN15_00395 [Thermoprotei archaeon]
MGVFILLFTTLGEIVAKKPTYRIENVVASVNLHQRIDLNAIAEHVPNTEYNPEQLGPL